MNGVDIIVPIYNCESTVEKCIESVLEQTYKEYTLILVDDGSKDGSGKICRNYAEKCENIVYYKQDNQGVSVARNRGLEIGNRDYIIFLDADDYLPNNSLNSYIENICELDDWIIGSYSAFRTYSKISYSNIIENGTYSYDEACAEFEKISKWLSTPWAKMYKRRIIESNNLWFDKSMTIGEDNKFNLLYFSVLNGRIKTLKSIVYCYKLGGVASAIKYHENIQEEYIKLAKTYDALEKIIGYQLSSIKYGLLSGVIKHYIVCLPKKKALKKIEDSYSEWRYYMFDNTEKWYLEFQNGDINATYHWYLISYFKEIVKKKAVRAIRLLQSDMIFRMEIVRK